MSQWWVNSYNIFLNVIFCHDFYLSPCCGNNHFLLALQQGLQQMDIHVVTRSNTDRRKSFQTFSQIQVANSNTYNGNLEVLKHLQKNSKVNFCSLNGYFNFFCMIAILDSLIQQWKHILTFSRKTRKCSKLIKVFLCNYFSISLKFGSKYEA